MTHHKIGLMLGGGGAKGTYQLGVLKALEEQGITQHINLIAGTSIGAINALLFLSSDSVADMNKMWNEIKMKEIYKNGFAFFKPIDGMFRLEKLERALKTYIDFDKVNQSNIDVYVTTCRLKYPKNPLSKILPNHLIQESFLLDKTDPEKCIKQVIASASVPYLFSSTEIDGHKFVDGGMAGTNPLQALIDQQCHTIFAIPLTHALKARNYEHGNLTVIDFSSQRMFHKNMIIDAIDILRFNDNRMKTRQSYGYRLGKELLSHLGENNLMDAIITSPKEKGFYCYRLKETNYSAVYRASGVIHSLNHKQNPNDAQPLGVLSSEVIELHEENDDIAI